MIPDVSIPVAFYKSALLKLATKSDLVCLKAKIDKIDVEKLKTAPADLNKLSNVVNNDIVKKTMYDKLVAKVSLDLF